MHTRPFSFFLRHPLAHVIALVATDTAASAQCTSLDSSFMRPRGDDVRSFAAFDVGG